MAKGRGIKAGDFTTFQASVQLDTSTASKSMGLFSKEMGKHSMQVQSGMKSITGEMKNLAGSILKARGILGMPLGKLGIGLGFFEIGRSAFELSQELNSLRNEMVGLSDKTGDTSQIFGEINSIWQGSIASMGTIKGVMSGLAAQGLPMATEGFEDLTRTISDVHVATGISTDTLGGLTGGLVNSWKVTVQTTKAIINYGLTTKRVFDITGREAEDIMQTTQKAIENLAPFFDNVEGSMKTLAKGIAGAAGAMQKFGVTSQESGRFFEKIFDPRQVQENMALFARLGISYEETMNMMTSAEGKEMFLDKMMRNIPILSKQIQSLKNPMARLKFAESLGMPLEIASKMAKATSGEIEGLLTKYKAEAEEINAIEEHQQNAALETARFNDTLFFIKTKTLYPLAKWVRENQTKFTDFLSKFGDVFNKIIKLGIPILDKVIPKLYGAIINLLDSIAPAIDMLSKPAGEGGGLAPFLKGVLVSFLKALGEGLKIVFIDVAWPAIKELFSNQGIIGKFVLALGAKKIFDFGKDFTRALIFGEKGSKRNPMYVKNVDDLMGGGGGLFNLAKRIFTRGKGAGGAAEEVLEKTGIFRKVVGGLGKTKLGTKLIEAAGAKWFGKAAIKTGLKLGMKGIGAAAKAIPVAGWIVSGVLGAVEGVMDADKIWKGAKKVTGGMKAASGIAGALTLGFGSMIDDFFGTTIVESFSRGLYRLGLWIQNAWNASIHAIQEAWYQIGRILDGAFDNILINLQKKISESKILKTLLFAGERWEVWAKGLEGKEVYDRRIQELEDIDIEGGQQDVIKLRSEIAKFEKELSDREGISEEMRKYYFNLTEGLKNKAQREEDRNREIAEYNANLVEYQAMIVQNTAITAAEAKKQTGFAGQIAKQTKGKEAPKPLAEVDFLSFWFNNSAYLKIGGV